MKGSRVTSWLLTVVFSLIMLLGAIGFFILIIRPTRGAELPNYIKCGKAECNYRPGEIDKFGRYSLKYYERRWNKMCQGAARYDAMREAYDMRRPNPC